VAEGHPARLRESLLLCDAMGALKAQAQEARAQMPQVASAYLAARLADSPPDLSSLVEAISVAEAEGLTSLAAEARAQLPRLMDDLFASGDLGEALTAVEAMEAAGLEAADARDKLTRVMTAVKKVRLRVGDRVQARNCDDWPWAKGTVKQMVDGRPKVQADEGIYSGDAYSLSQVQPLVITQLQY